MAVDVTDADAVEACVGARRVERFGAVNVARPLGRRRRRWSTTTTRGSPTSTRRCGTGSSTCSSTAPSRRVPLSPARTASRPPRAAARSCLVATTDALVGVAGLDAYTAAKGGVVALTRSFAAGMAPDGVRVNAIAPSFVATEPQQRWLADPARPRRSTACTSSRSPRRSRSPRSPSTSPPTSRRW